VKEEKEESFVKLKKGTKGLAFIEQHRGGGSANIFEKED